MSYKDQLKQLFPSIIYDEETDLEEYVFINPKEIVEISKSLKSLHFNLILEFGIENFKNQKGITLIYVFEKADYRKLLIIQSKINNNAESIAQIYPTAVLYEREMQDGFGIEFNHSFDTRKLFLHEYYPEGFHPLKKSFTNAHLKLKGKVSPSEDYFFKKINGEGVYEISVGPIHAGIIAPGHFRFNVIGETILNLEIRHFWKHRGIEKSAENKTPEEGVVFAESICGDETIANTLAYCIAIEKISGIKVSKRAEHLRVLCAEMERIYSLLGDIAGMIVDVAYPMGASQFFNLREEILRWNERLTGSRFCKGMLIIGGVSKDVNSKTLDELEEYLNYFYSQFTSSFLKILENASVLDRFETTGIIKESLVKPLNLTGPLARASGVNKDERICHPYAKTYEQIMNPNKILNQGDVLSRFRIKANTIKNSANIILRIIKNMPKGEMSVNYDIKDGCSFSIVESSRGQNIMFINIKNKKIDRFKVRTASFCNWYAIEHAVMGNIVPDFPLINKSLNLSYEGNDL
ncbi:MAG: NADH-quinone oxidoreductase subunit C [Methanocellales archaeon]|nr:NADH-quinone oxidoreductase subunit C [Methanocellales archaeon]MDD5446428.1 NADH-quinone oxidoreductase subunit C [Methanocellales archaeon]